MQKEKCLRSKFCSLIVIILHKDFLYLKINQSVKQDFLSRIIPLHNIATKLPCVKYL